MNTIQFTKEIMLDNIDQLKTPDKEKTTLGNAIKDMQETTGTLFGIEPKDSTAAFETEAANDFETYVKSLAAEVTVKAKEAGLNEEQTILAGVGLGLALGQVMAFTKVSIEAGKLLQAAPEGARPLS